MVNSRSNDGNTSKVAQHVATCIDRLKGRKSQREVAIEAGYDKPNMLSMIKTGTARVPLEKILPLAMALETDPALMFRLALEQYWPNTEEVVAKIFGMVPSANERQILLIIRNASGGTDPHVSSKVEEGLTTLFTPDNTGE